MEANKRNFKAIGLVRIGLYAFFFFFSSLFWMIFFLSFIPRFLPFLRFLSIAGVGVVFVLAAITSFLLVNSWLFVPISTRIVPGGFISIVPFRAQRELQVHFSEIGTIFELGVGTLVTIRKKGSSRTYNLIFGKDTDGYYRLTDTLKDGLNEFRTGK